MEKAVIQKEECVGVCFAPHTFLNDFLTLDKNLLAPFRPPLSFKIQPGSWYNRHDDNVKCF